MTRCFPVVCFLFVLGLVTLAEQSPLNDYIRHYEEVNFDKARLHEEHSRARRSTQADAQITLKFRAFNRDFHLQLQRDNSIFSRNHVTLDNGKLIKPDTTFIYSGSLVDQPNSEAHVSIVDGRVRGHIEIPHETTYHIEPAEQYFKKPKFHAVVYDERHVNLDPYRHRREAERGACGNGQHLKWMKEVSESAYEAPNRAKRTLPSFEEEEPNFRHNKYSAELNREKRNTGDAEKRTCYLYLRSDPMLWDYIKFRKYPGEQLPNERVKEEILAFFASHVAALKAIYSRTVFTTYDKSMRYDSINFLVQRTGIMTNTTEHCGSAQAKSWCNPNIDVSNFLNLNSRENHDDFCLAYVFTFRDFTQGTLGLAWVGSETKAAGGICEKNKDYPKGNTGTNEKKSLNTGIVTVVNYGKPVQSRVSQLTFAHEVGHNFGSPHDSGPTCAPYGTNSPDASRGNYIMFASATMGDKANNDHFSICSLDNITRVLNAVFKQQGGKVDCFQASKSAFCGNGIVEEGEQCDCGYADDCADKCCHGRGSDKKIQCTLKTSAKCSPTAGPCCTKECEFLDLSSNTLCKSQDECSKASYCNGTWAGCPDPDFEKNDTFCNSFSQVCLNGECIGSVCQKIQWEECFLTNSDDKSGPSREELCFVSCRKSSQSACVSSYNTDDVNKPENKAFHDLLVEIAKNLTSSPSPPPEKLKLPAGSPCDNFRGYCDVFHRCRGVDADGPLARLKNLIFNPKTLQSIREWIVVHWWAVMLMGIGLVVVMGVFIKVCAVHTPSSNPHKPAARKLTLPRRHHGQGNKPQARSVPIHDPPPPYSSSASSSGPPPPGHGKHHRHNNNKQGGKQNRGQRYEMQPRAYSQVPYDEQS